MRYYKYHFRHNPAKLQEMLALRRRGFSYGVLSIIYECPKSTIRFMVRKNGLTRDAIKPLLGTGTQGRVPFVVIQMPHTTRKQPQIRLTFSNERINPGKSYADYLLEEKNRHKRDLSHGYTFIPKGA